MSKSIRHMLAALREQSVLPCMPTSIAPPMVGRYEAGQPYIAMQGRVFVVRYAYGQAANWQELEDTARQAEQTEVVALATRSDLAALELNLVPPMQPRRRASWPAELNAAVEAALTREQVRPPDGVSWADWERVLAARRAGAICPIEELRHLLRSRR